MPKLVNIKAEPGYKLQLTYSDGIEGVYDLNHLRSKDEFKSIFTDDEFERVFIDRSTNEIAWSGGIRLCQNSVYRQLQLKALMNRLHIDLNKL